MKQLVATLCPGQAPGMVRLAWLENGSPIETLADLTPDEARVLGLRLVRTAQLTEVILTDDSDAAAHKRVKARMRQIDALTPEQRACVHEYGWTIVNAFLLAGVTKPKQIHHLVRTVWEGSVEIGKREPNA